MTPLRDCNLPWPSYMHLLPVITSTTAVVFSFKDSMLLKSLLNPSVPPTVAPTIWASYIGSRNNLVMMGIDFIFGGGALVWSAGVCFASLTSHKWTRGPAKALYMCGIAFSLLNFFVFYPQVAKISKKIIDGPSNEAKDEMGALLEVQTSRRRLAELPAMMCFTVGFARLCRLR